MSALDVEEFKTFAAQFVMQLKPRSDGAALVTLSGDLGAGKTTFVQAAAKALGVDGTVTSPTFVIEKIYELKDQRFERLVHIDAYRLESSDELERLGFKELLRDPKVLVLLEWPEKVPELIPDDAIKLRFDIAGEKRTISIDGQEKS